MPRFPLEHQLALPATFASVIPGRLHPDGRRYLPLLVLALEGGALIAVVDRHHRVPHSLEGSSGVARLVFLLSALTPQPPGAQRRGLETGPLAPGRASTAPDVFGEVVAVPTWEIDDRTGQEALYTELLLDIGIGVVGVRTSMTAPRIADALGTARIRAGDWLAIRRSRIDILEFVPTS